MIVIPRADPNICKHKNVSVTFKTVNIWVKANKQGKVKLPKTIKVSDLCIKSVECYDCGKQIGYERS